MARYARVVSMETWNRRNEEEDEAGFEGRRRRRRKQRRRKDSRRGGKRQARQGQARQGRQQARRSQNQDGGYPEEAQQERQRPQAAPAQQSPDFVYDEVPEDDDPEPEGDFGAPFRPGRKGARAARKGAPAGPRKGPFGPRQARDAAERRGLFPRGVGKRIREGLAPPWSPAVALGPNLKMKARKGFRAAVVEVKPGLFVVAEVPERSVEFGLGPLLLAPALVKTLGRAFRRRQAGQGQPGVQQQQPPSQPAALPAPPPRAALPGPVEEDDRLARWLDDDIAAELGCRACERRG